MMWKLLGVFLVFFLLVTVSSAYTINEVVEDDEELDEVREVSRDETVREVSRDETVFDEIATHNRAITGDKKVWLFEADIALVDQPEDRAGETPESSVESRLTKRSLRRSQEYLWIDRVIPYEITSEVANGKEMIESALDTIQKQSCLTFVERTTQKNWIRFVNKGACFSSVGRSFWLQGYQIISLSSSCLNSPGTIMHEILHSLGFWHEQSRPDRDQFVEVNWENIATGEEHNFAKYTRGESDDLNSNYDHSSIMHYGRFSFSKNGRPTIVAVGDKNKKLGQRERLSTEDVIQLNALYRCQDVGKTYTTWSDWGPCDDNCMKSRQRFCSNYDKSRCPESSRFGVHTQNAKCSTEECNKPQAGHWGRWSSWGECSHPCGSGNKRRTRVCDDPKPKHGGANCGGESSQQEVCYIMPCGLGADDCQFDGQGMCFWKDNSVLPNKYKWQRITGKTPSGRTGPSNDHSTDQSSKDGYYLFTESSAPAQTGSKASIVSKVFHSINNRCLTFFYSMHGLGIGALRVFIVTEGTKAETKLWEKDGPQGDGWKEQEVDFSSRFAYKIRFESERGPSFQGDIGLDDIHFSDTKCSEKGTKEAARTPQPTQPTLPPTTAQPTIEPISSVCNVPIRPLGCFADIPSDPSLPTMLDSHRGNNRLFHGFLIDWKNYDITLKELLCHCINRAKDRGMKYIGLQYYGECWGGFEPTYNRYGISTRCKDSKYKACYHENKQEICVGEGQTNYAYEIL